MITSKNQKVEKRIEIDIRGPQGNVYFLLGTAKQYAHQLGLEWEHIKKEMTSSDYENAIQVFDSYFGKYVILYR